MINYIDTVHFQNLPIYGVRIHPTTGFPSSPSNGQIVYDTASNRYFFYKANLSGWYLLGSGSMLPEWNAISGGVNRQSNETFIMRSGGAIRYSGGGIVDANRFNGRQTLAISDGGTNSTSAFANAIVFTNVSADTYLTDAYLRAQYSPTQYSISLGDTAGGPFRAALTLGNESLAPAFYIAPHNLVSPTGANYLEWDGNYLYITDQYCLARARLLTNQDLLSSMTGILPLNLGGTNNNRPYQSGSIIITDGNQYLGIRPSGSGYAGLLQVGENLSNGSGYKWLVGQYSYPAEVPMWDGSEWNPIDSIQYFVYNSPNGSNFNYIIPSSGEHALKVQLGSAIESYEGFFVKSPTGANVFTVNGSGRPVFYEGVFRLYGPQGTMVDFRSAASGQTLSYNGDKWLPATTAGGPGGATIHNALLGLDNDDHLHYLHRTPSGTPRNVISGSANNITPLTILGHGSQTNNLLEIKHPTDNRLFTNITNSGNIHVGAISGGLARIIIGSGATNFSSLLIEPSTTFPNSASLCPPGSINVYNKELYYKVNPTGDSNRVALADTLPFEQQFLGSTRAFEDLALYSSADARCHILTQNENDTWNTFPKDINGSIVVVPFNTSHAWNDSRAVVFGSGNGVSGVVDLRRINSGDLPANIMYTGIASLTNLNGVSINNPQFNERLTYSGGIWTNLSITGFIEENISSSGSNFINVTGVNDFGLLITRNQSIVSSMNGYGHICAISGITLGTGIRPTTATSGLLTILGTSGTPSVFIRNSQYGSQDIFSIVNYQNSPILRVATDGKIYVGNRTQADSQTTLNVSGSIASNINVYAVNGFSFINSNLGMFARTALADVGNIYSFQNNAGTSYQGLQCGHLQIMSTPQGNVGTYAQIVGGISRQGVLAGSSGLLVGSSGYTTTPTQLRGTVDIWGASGRITCLVSGPTGVTSGDILRLTNPNVGTMFSVNHSGVVSYAYNSGRIQVAQGFIAGTGILVGGVANIANPFVTNNSHIQITVRQLQAGSLANVGIPVVYRQIANSGFMIRSTNASDTSSFCWELKELI